MNFIDWKDSWFISAVAISIVYNILVFHFSSKILQGFTQKKIVIPFLAIVNTILVVLLYKLNVPRTLFYILGTFLLCLEFLFISKSTLKQCFFGAAVFFLNISSIHSLIISVLSIALNVYPFAVFQYASLFFQSLAITYFVLISVLFLVSSSIPFDDIIKISVAKRYSEILSIITFVIICYISLVTHFLVAQDSYEQLIILSFSTTIFSALIFYYFFLYSMNFVKMFVYKRRNEKFKDSHFKLISEKRKIEQEISKDGLTQLYTKKFIYEALETLCLIREVGYAVLFVDINGLKFVNDTYGHEAGDRYICRVANAIKTALRERDLAARIGGDEFFVILDSIPEQDVQVVINLFISIQSEIEEFPITASIGSLYIDTELCEEGWKSIVDCVDKQMLNNKQQFYTVKGDLYS